MNNIKNFREKSLALTNDKAQSETYLRYNAEEASASKSPKQAGISLRQYIAALARSYKSIILWSLLLALLGLGAALLQHKTYTANTTIKIETDHTRIFNFDVDTTKPASYVNDVIFYNTQYKLLRSRDLATRVIDQMKMRDYLLEEKRFKAPIYAIKDFFSSISERIKSFFPSGPESGFKETVLAEDIFLRNLQIKPVKNSRVLEITYTSQDPVLARDVLKSLTSNFITISSESRQGSTEFAKDYLDEQLANSRKKLQETEEKLIKYARDKAIVDTETDKSIIANNLESLSQAYMRAKEGRIKAENQYRNKSQISAALNTSEDAVIQERKLERNKLQAEYNAKLAMFKPAYPEMRALKQQIDELSHFIQSEGNSINKNTTINMKANYDTAISDEVRIGEEIKKLEKNLLDIRDNSIGYMALKRDVDTSRSLYEGLLQRLKEVSVAGPVQTDNVSVVDSPVLPSEKDGPKYALYMILGSLLGLLLGSLRSFWRETVRPKVRNLADLDWLAGQCGVIAAMPHVHGKRTYKLATLATDRPHSKLAEAVRSLRTALALENNGQLPKVIHLTSCHPSEGKTTIAINLASSLAQTGKRILLIDADLRKPAVHRYLRLDNNIGLANYLAGERIVPQKIEGFDRFMVMCAGPALVDTVQGLDSKQMSELLHKARLVFDHVIIDAPPTLGMADSLVLANRADGTLLVVADERSTHQEINEVIGLIRQSQGSIIGVIHNMSRQKSTHTYSQRSYSDGRSMLKVAQT